MAATEESFKSFLARRKQEYSLKFPFLRESQIVAKLKRIWASQRLGNSTSHALPNSTRIKVRPGDKNAKHFPEKKPSIGLKVDQQVNKENLTPGSSKIAGCSVMSSTFSLESPASPPRNTASKLGVATPTNFLTPQSQDGSSTVCVPHGRLQLPTRLKHSLENILTPSDTQDNQCAENSPLPCLNRYTKKHPLEKAVAHQHPLEEARNFRKLCKRNQEGSPGSQDKVGILHPHLEKKPSKQVHWQPPTVLGEASGKPYTQILTNTQSGRPNTIMGCEDLNVTSSEDSGLSPEEEHRLKEKLEAATPSLSPVMKSLPSLQLATPTVDKMLCGRIHRKSRRRVFRRQPLNTTIDVTLNATLDTGDELPFLPGQHSGLPDKSLDSFSVTAAAAGGACYLKGESNTNIELSTPEGNVDRDDEVSGSLTHPVSSDAHRGKSTGSSFVEEKGERPMKQRRRKKSASTQKSTPSHENKENKPQRGTRKRQREAPTGPVRVTRRMAALQKSFLEECNLTEVDIGDFPAQKTLKIEDSSGDKSAFTPELPSNDSVVKDTACSMEIPAVPLENGPTPTQQGSDTQLLPKNGTGSPFVEQSGEAAKQPSPVNKPLLSPVKQDLMCDMFFPLTPERQKYDFFRPSCLTNTSSNRRVFLSSKKEGDNNFYTMFTDESDIFM